MFAVSLSPGEVPNIGQGVLFNALNVLCVAMDLQIVSQLKRV